MTMDVWARLLPVLIAVESNGDPNAIGDQGRAVGILQIRECVVADVNRLYHRRFRWPDDCRSEWASTCIAVLYLSHYAGRDASAETWARVWNGGPRGATGTRRRATDGYWRRVQARMEGRR